MSVLLIETLQSSLSQEIDYTSETRVEIAGLYPYIYFHNVTGAVFTFEIKRGVDIVFEQDFTSEDIRLVSGDYAHVFFPVIPEFPLQLEEGSYTFSIKAKSGYVAGSTFIGWVKQYQDIQNEMSYIPSSSASNTFALRFKKYTEGITI